MDGDPGAEAEPAIAGAGGVGGDGVARWEFDRRRARRGAAVCALLMIGGVAACVAGVLIAPDPLDLEAAPGQTAAVIFVCGVIAVAIGAIVGADFGAVARWGGGFVAWPAGLEFRIGRRRMLLPWSAIGRVGLEFRSSGRATFEVLAIHLVGAAYRWPRSMLLAGSTPRCLAVTTYVLGERAAQAADGIADGAIRFTPQPSMTEPAVEAGSQSAPGFTQPIQGARRRGWKQLGLVAFLWTLVAAVIFGLTTVSIPEGNWVNVVIGTVMGAGAALLGLLFWRIDPETFDEL